MKSKGELDYGTLNISLVVFILMIIGVNGLYNRAFNQAYIQIEYLVILIIFLLIVFYFCAKGLKELRTIDIYTEKITFKYLGIRLRTVPFSKIIAYSTFVDDKTHFIKFTTNKKTYLINRNLLSNEDELMTAFKIFKDKRNQQLNSEEYRNIKNRETLLLGLLGLILIIFSALHFIFKPDTVANKSELVSITGTLKEKFEIYKPTLRSPGRFITFKINQNDEFTFRIGPGYDKIDLGLLENHTPNDTLRMLIGKLEFDTKIQRSRTPSFKESHFNWTTIYVKELHVNNNRILSATDYYDDLSENEKSNNLWAPIIGIVGLEILRRAKKAYRQQRTRSIAA